MKKVRIRSWGHHHLPLWTTNGSIIARGNDHKVGLELDGDGQEDHVEDGRQGYYRGRGEERFGSPGRTTASSSKRLLPQGLGDQVSDDVEASNGRLPAWTKTILVIGRAISLPAILRTLPKLESRRRVKRTRLRAGM